MRVRGPDGSGWERSDAMVTRNTKGSTKRLAVLSALGVVALFAWSSRAAAQPSSDYPAGYVVLPKILVHTTGGTPPVVAGGTAVDTIIQITNTNQAAPINVDCFWVDANSHCGTIDGTICDTTADCPLGLQCLPFWRVGDFGAITLTQGQPIGLVASTGLPALPCDPNFPGPGCIGNASGSVTKVPEDPFRGELKCVEVDANDIPIGANDLKIEATIVTTTIPTAVAPATTAASYNGVGFQATTMQPITHPPGAPLCLGSLPPGSGTATCNATYQPCSSVLILDNFFDGATPEFGGVVNTELTLVPCSEDLSDPTVSATHTVTVQILVYNEFEQRTSSVTRVACFRSTTLADIDTAPGPAGDTFSLFAVGVQGTETGQTLLRGVRGPDGILGYGLLGVASENFRETVGGPILATDAFNIHESLSGFTIGDAVYLDIR